MSIVVVGPTYPYRGGIAHYTTILVQELRKEYPTIFYSFKRQYPAFLFPGKTDRDNSANPLQVECEYLLDPLNPITWHNTARKIKAVSPDLLLMSWWHPYWSFVWLYLIGKAKRQGIKITFIVHNVVSHEARIWDKWLTQAVLSKADEIIVHSEDELNRLKALLPNAPAQIVHHPTYAPLNSNGSMITQQEARKRLRLPINKPVLLFFGFVRPYKGLSILLEAIARIKEELELHLLIVGEFWLPEQGIRETINRLKIANNVTIVNKYIPNEEIEQYFAAADVVTLPYINATGSGIAQLAFGFGKPVIATSTGGLKEAVSDGKTGLLIPSNDSEALANALLRFFNDMGEHNWTEEILNNSKQFSWRRMTAKIIEAVA